jgi:putative PIN family toxin of toxin-antitoxin system
MIKVVFDTNVLISGLLWEGIPHDLLNMVKNRELKLYLSIDIIKELEEVLNRKKFEKRITDLNVNTEDLISR